MPEPLPIQPTKCRNCGMLFEGNFCNNCGQKHIEHRLNAPFIWKDLIEGVFNFDSGVFFTAMQLSLRPGYSIRSFIEGKRVNYTSPIAYLIITASIFGLLYHFFEPNFAELYQTSSTQFRNLGAQIIGSIYSHYTISSLLLIPLTTVLSYVIFKKQGYRIIEHAILNIYITGHTILIRIVFFLCLFLIKEHIELSSLRWIFQIIYFPYLTWCYAQFFKQIKPIKVILLTLLYYIATFLSALIIVTAIVLYFSKHEELFRLLENI